MPSVKNILSGAIAAGCIAGCTEVYSGIGDKWNEINSHLIVIDTCSVDISSVRLDSIVTSKGNIVYAGIRESEYWGTTSMSTYLTFKTSGDYNDSSTPEYAEEIVFDSLTLYLFPDSTFCGDTMQEMKLMVHRLSEQVEMNDDGELYAHSVFGYEPYPVAEKTIMPHPFRKKAVEIRLSDELGKELLDKVINSEPEVEDNSSFRDWFKGLLLTAGGQSRSIMSFKGQDSLCMMKLYYSSRDYAELEEHTLDFKIDTSYMFTHIDADLSGTPVENLPGMMEELDSAESGHQAFSSGILGIYTRIGFPYLNELRRIGDHCKAASAKLTIYPKKGTYCKPNYSSLPSSLALYISDENNISTGGAITDTAGESLQTGSLTYDDMMFPESTYYTYDITSFINNQLGKIGVRKNYLQMIDPSYGYTLDELIVADQDSGEEYNIKLTIELAVYDE